MYSRYLFIVTVMSLVLSACGGGGGSSDTTPDNFSFTAATGQERDTQVTSSAITVAGIDSATDVSITGGEFAIGGGTFITSGEVVNGDTIVVRGTSSSDFSASVNVVLTIGGVSSTFTITTEDQDITPAAFSFTDVTDAPLSTLTTSNAITITDINDAAPISITGGEYSIDGGAFTNAAGTVNEGQMVVVQAISSNMIVTDVDVLLNVGGVEDTFTISTLDDNEAPVVTVEFPPPATMTDGEVILVRGTSSDVGTAVSSVQVNGIDANTDNGFANWQVEVPLAEGENNLVVSVIDSVANLNDNLSIDVRRDSPPISPFPDGNVPFNSATSIAIDELENRVLIVNNTEIIAVSLLDGSREVFSDNNFENIAESYARLDFLLIDGSNGYVSDINVPAIFQLQLSGENAGQKQNIMALAPEESIEFIEPGTVLVDPNDENRLFICDRVLGVLTLNLSDGSRSAFSSTSDTLAEPTPNSDNPFNGLIGGCALDRQNDRIVVVDGLSSFGNISVKFIDIESGVRTVLSGAYQDLLISRDSHFTVDAVRNRILVAGASQVVAIDLSTGDDSVFTGVDADNFIQNIEHVFYDGTSGYVFILDSGAGSLTAADIVTGERVVVSGRFSDPE